MAPISSCLISHCTRRKSKRGSSKAHGNRNGRHNSRVNSSEDKKIYFILFTFFLFSYLIAIPVGIISATTKYKSLDNALKFISYLGIALPNFLVALCIMLFMTIYYGDTMTGLFSQEYENESWSSAKLMDFLSRAWLPIFVLGWNATAFALQTVRALMLDENDKLYVMAARARGVSGMSLLWRYPAKHSLGPVINSIGFDLIEFLVHFQ